MSGERQRRRRLLLEPIVFGKVDDDSFGSKKRRPTPVAKLRGCFTDSWHFPRAGRLRTWASTALPLSRACRVATPRPRSGYVGHGPSASASLPLLPSHKDRAVQQI